MAEFENYTKRADTKYRKMAFALNQDVPQADISWNRVWEIFCDVGNLGGGLETNHKKGTTEFDLYKGDDIVHTFSWKNEDVFNDVGGDWDWGKIFKTVVPYIIDNKLIKKPRAKRKDAGKAKKLKKKSAKKLNPAYKYSKSDKTTENLGDFLKSDISILELFDSPKNQSKCELSKIEIERWRKKRFSARLSMYNRYKKGLPFDSYMKRYIDITKTMRNLGINAYITGEWIKDYFGLLH